jgi:hypothetical protein
MVFSKINSRRSHNVSANLPPEQLPLITLSSGLKRYGTFSTSVDEKQIKIGLHKAADQYQQTGMNYSDGRWSQFCVKDKKEAKVAALNKTRSPGH